MLNVNLAIMTLLLFGSVPDAAAESLSDYSVKQLLEPCMEGDNDSRWGSVAEAECEQYIKGFTDAYLLMTDDQTSADCLPAEGNRPDEIRWAFMKWAHRHYEQRHLPAGEGLMLTIRSAFKCP